MFDIGWSEMMLIGVVALIVIGPKELPGMLRTVGRTITKLRRMAGEFQGQSQDALKEAELSEMRSEIGNIADSARKSFAGTETFDPLRSIREEIRSTVEGGAKPAAASPVAPEGVAPDAVTDPLALASAPTTPVTMEPLVPLPEAPAEPKLDLAAYAPEPAPLAEPMPLMPEPTPPAADAKPLPPASGTPT
jgi:sec-independent protein translocase protein TatB